MPRETHSTEADSADIFSFGVCVWEMYTRSYPWRALLEAGRTDELRLRVGRHAERLNISCLPPAVRTLVEACFRASPADRPAFREIQRIGVEKLVFGSAIAEHKLRVAVGFGRLMHVLKPPLDQPTSPGAMLQGGAEGGTTTSPTSPRSDAFLPVDPNSTHSNVVGCAPLEIEGASRISYEVPMHNGASLTTSTESSLYSEAAQLSPPHSRTITPPADPPHATPRPASASAPLRTGGEVWASPSGAPRTGRAETSGPPVSLLIPGRSREAP